MFCQGRFKVCSQGRMKEEEGGRKIPSNFCLTNNKSPAENKTCADKCRCYFQQKPCETMEARRRAALCCAPQKSSGRWDGRPIAPSMGTEAVISAVRPDSISHVRVPPLMFSSPLLSSPAVSFPPLRPALTLRCTLHSSCRLLCLLSHPRASSCSSSSPVESFNTNSEPTNRLSCQTWLVAEQRGE